MRKKRLVANVENVLKLLSKKVDTFKGESRRSYKKAFSSIQLYALSNYNLRDDFDKGLVENWLASLWGHGLKINTVTFYLEKIGSLYSAIAPHLEGGRAIDFKEIKKGLKELTGSGNLRDDYREVAARVCKKIRGSRNGEVKGRLAEELKNYPLGENTSSTVAYIWGSLALTFGIKPNVVKGILKDVPSGLEILNLCRAAEVTESERKEAMTLVGESLKGEKPEWFALKLRPRVKFEFLLQRISSLDSAFYRPELFYPYEEIARQIGRKLTWTGKPVIRDVVFFKMRKSDIYPLFCHLYDLAWCYKNPGGRPGDYAVIPGKSMEEFKSSLGLLTPDFEVSPAGEMKLNPGDEVVILSGTYADRHAKILKAESENGNKIFRVSLMNLNGRWEIGIDARLIKKV